MTETGIVLITGSAGRIGRAAVRALKSAGHVVRGFDLVPTPDAEESITGNLIDPVLVQQAMKGVRALVHLAATPDDDDFMEKLLPNNVVGTYNVLEAARLAGVGRVVLASSGQVVWWQRQRGPLPIGPDVPVTPRAWYAATKVFQEAAGRALAEGHDRSVIAVRLGWCPRSRDHLDELAQTEWGPDVYLSPGDAGRVFACAVAAPATIRFAVVYASSRPVRQNIFDLGPARQLLGYEPQDTWPQGSEEIV